MKSLLPMLLLLISCTTTVQTMHKTGRYTIKTIAGDQVTFTEVKGTYLIASDTLKVGDKIVINVIGIKKR